jgi:hypothetical protein
MKKTNASSPALLRTKKQILKRMHKKKMEQIRLKTWIKRIAHARLGAPIEVEKFGQKKSH